MDREEIIAVFPKGQYSLFTSVFYPIGIIIDGINRNGDGCQKILLDSISDTEGLCCIDRGRTKSGSLRSRDQAARAKSLLTRRTSPMTPCSNRMHWRFRIIRITSKPLMVA